MSHGAKQLEVVAASYSTFRAKRATDGGEPRSRQGQETVFKTVAFVRSAILP